MINKAIKTFLAICLCFVFVGCRQQSTMQDTIYEQEIEISEESHIEEIAPAITNAPLTPLVSPAPEAPQSETITISISAATILNNMDRFNPQKQHLIPPNGIILNPVTLEFREGLSVFDYLKKITSERDISLRYSSIPSVYVREIAGIAEFDGGGTSGWQYKVNGIAPNVGMGSYRLKNGDRVEILYTCDLGRDL
jgi:hypothetical protein